jgi:crotonobetainyl-CoA:carnitine CoA-transferase CaiB-like acyl-CoA transferase
MAEWKKFTNTDLPLAGVRVLSMEQAAALPFATRHLADLGAEIIRVQSHNRPAPQLGIDADALRNKLQLGLDLSKPRGPETFLRVAAHCDIVAHNFTPRVMRQYGLDYEGVRAVRPDVIYVSITGFGIGGPWGERPLFGPGSEAMSGHNLLIGEPDGWPGRPPTLVYSDDTCGLNAVFAVLAALDERDRGGGGAFIDLSLYECAVSLLGPVVAERSFGSATPSRVGNHDHNYAVHGVFTSPGHDRHVAVSALPDQTEALVEALGIAGPTESQVAAALSSMDAEEAASRLRAAGIAAVVVADASTQAADPHLSVRGFFGLLERRLAGIEGTYPHAGPAWGGGPGVTMTEPRPVGADSRLILRDIAGLTEAEIDALYAAGAAGEIPAPERAAPAPLDSGRLGVERGELSRVDERPLNWPAAKPEVTR